MSGTMNCALCGKPIEVGEAWMESDDSDEAAERAAHAGCIYRDEHRGDDPPRWRPSPRIAP